MVLPSDLKITNSLIESQIIELINYTNNDSLIGKFTHDYERYKNREMYDKWAQEERSLYILTNEQNSLLGMVKFEVDGRNEVAIKLYEYLGFKKVTIDDSWIMVLT